MNWIVLIFLSAGTFFIVIASIGLLKMPDLYMRMSATTKAATLGVGFMLVAVAVYFNDMSIGTRTVTAIIFLFLTAPVGAHMIGKAAYYYGIPLWKGSKKDDLKSQFDKGHKEEKEED